MLKEYRECMCLFVCARVCVHTCVLVLGALGRVMDLYILFTVTGVLMMVLHSFFLPLGLWKFSDLHYPALCGFMAWLYLRPRGWTLIRKHMMCFELENQLK